MSHDTVGLGLSPDDYTTYNTTTVPQAPSLPFFDFDYDIYNSLGDEVTGILTSEYNPYDSYSWINDYEVGKEATYSIDVLLNVRGNLENVSSSYLETLSTEINFGGSQSIFDFSNASLTEVGSDFNFAVTSLLDPTLNTIQFTGAVGDQVENTTGLKLDGSSETKLFTIEGVKVSDVFQSGELYYDDDPDNFITGDFLTKKIDNITASVDGYDTVISNRSDENANIKSLYELEPTASTLFDVTGDAVAIEAKTNFVNYATSVYTQRFIGSDDKTSLIREGAQVKASAYWSNLGSYKADINYMFVDEDYSMGNITLDDYSFVTDDMNSPFIDGMDISNFGYNGVMADIPEEIGLNGFGEISTVDTLQLDLDLTVTGSAGERIDESQFRYGIYALNNDYQSQSSDSVITNNLITFQGDLNYDGRVSLKDLAFLNAGKLAEADGEQFSDVDANHDNTISAADLAVLSSDWGQTLHQDFTSTDVFSNTNWSYKDVNLVDPDNTKYADQEFLDYAAITPMLNDVVYENSSFNYQSTVDSYADSTFDNSISSQLLNDSGLS